MAGVRKVAAGGKDNTLEVHGVVITAEAGFFVPSQPIIKSAAALPALADGNAVKL